MRLSSIELTGSGHRPASETAKSVTLATLAAALAIAIGWSLREDFPLSARSGLGYALGIVGLTAMCVLLSYSLRKRVSATRNWGAIRSWFRFHMILGIVGPVAVLYHAGFQLGSLNSAVALWCALLVSGSGLLGRVVYTRIHAGLSGHRLTLEDLRYELDSERGGIEKLAPELGRSLAELQNRIPPASTSLLGTLLDTARVSRAAGRARSRCRAWLRRASADAGRATRAGVIAPDVARQLRSMLDEYFGVVRRCARLAVYERVFSLWHALHLPLCFLLYVSAAIHVVAVHMY